MFDLKLWNQRRLHSVLTLTGVLIGLATLVGACGFNKSAELVPLEPLPTMTPIAPTAIPMPTVGNSQPVLSTTPGTGFHRMPSIADVVEEIRPWVVSITTESFRRGFFTTFRDEGAGSGIIIRTDGYILTNEHVVRSAREIEVHLPDGESYRAIVVGTDIVTDLAVLKIAAKGLPSAKLAESGKLRVGDWVMTMGNALNLKGGPTVTLGIVSGLGRSIETAQGEQFFDLIQTDATINTGNSGGPLVDVEGNVVGINQAVLQEARFGVAVSLDVMRPVIEDLIEFGRVLRPDMGINGDDVTSAIARSFQLPVEDGVIVTATKLNGPAYKAGIRTRDIITKIDDIPTPDLASFQRLLWSYEPGAQVVVEYFHNGQAEVATVELGERR